MSETAAQAHPLPSEETLRDVVATLAAIPDRGACSPGEREAAEWLAARFLAAGADTAELEDETSWGTFPPNIVAAAGLGIAGGLLNLAGRRFLGGVASIASGLAIADEIQNGPRIFRKAIRSEKTTVNVLAKAGDPDGSKTLVLLAHHDAAQTGFMFDQTAVAAFHERYPNVIPKIKTQPPQWWGTFLGPIMGLVSALTGRRGPATAAIGMGVSTTIVIGDMWRSEIVPGANDNLSACAVEVALAEMLREKQVPGLRVWLVSAGAEETLQDGIRAFMERHASELDTESTYFLCVDSVASPRLVMLEGEGPMWMEDYDSDLRETVAGVAKRDGLALERGFRARASTDAIIPQRHGFKIANLASVNDYHYLSNYHLPSDTAENADYSTIVEAAKVAYALAAELAGD